MKKDVITFRLGIDKKKALDAIAQIMNRDRAYVLNEAVDEFIELYQWQLSHIKKGLEQADGQEFASEEQIKKALKKWEQ